MGVSTQNVPKPPPGKNVPKPPPGKNRKKTEKTGKMGKYKMRIKWENGKKEI